MSKTDLERRNIFKKWLETLQQESWQLELLISGFALYGIFEAKVFLDDIVSYLRVHFYSNSVSGILGILVLLLRGSWLIFVINLTIHIVLRGLWIGAIGLRYVSEDINYEKLRFSPYFEKLYRRRYESFDDYIEDLERLCSVIFAYTFLLFFILVSACLFLVWPFLLPNWLDKDSIGFVIIIYGLLGFMVFIDFILLNPIKKIKGKWFNRVYGIIFRFYSTITLSFIFRPILLNFLDNKFTKKLFLLSIPYGLIIIIILPLVSAKSHAYFPEYGQDDITPRAYNAYAYNEEMYANLKEESYRSKVRYLILDKDTYESNVISYFIPMLETDEDYLEKRKNVTPFNKKGVFITKRKEKENDPWLKEEKRIHDSILVSYVYKKSDEESEEMKQYWEEQKNEENIRYNNLLYEYRKKQSKQVMDYVLSESEFTIDSIDAMPYTQCFYYKFGKFKQPGWKCITVIDSLESGVHYFKLKRGVYSSKLDDISYRIVEIPFILDHK